MAASKCTPSVPPVTSPNSPVSCIAVRVGPMSAASRNRRPRSRHMTLSASASRLRMAAVLFVCIAGFYWKLTLTQQFDWLAGPDSAEQVLPWFHVQAQEWHAGRIPLWDPYLWTGQPLLGQGQPGAAYPLNWILFLLPLQNGHIAGW